MDNGFSEYYLESCFFKHYSYPSDFHVEKSRGHFIGAMKMAAAVARLAFKEPS